MTARKNSPEVLALSIPAQAVLAGNWMLSKGFTITFQNQKTSMSEVCATAMAELIVAGFVSDEKADDGYPESRTYRLTEKGAAMDFRKPMKWMDQHGSFPITKQIEAAA